jgi:hypothetical protein
MVPPFPDASGFTSRVDGGSAFFVRRQDTPKYMKAPVAVALIIVGGILILAPATTDYLARGQVVALMTGRNVPDASLQPPPMSSAYRFGCWFSGGVMIAAAVFMSRNSKQQ